VALGNAFLGRPTSCSAEYTLLEGTSDNRCPFYVNYGFLAGPAELLARLYQGLLEMQPEVETTTR
jgi:hypothetical protein